MSSWEIIASGLGAIACGAFLLYGFDRGWFSDHYTYTVQGGEGSMVFGLMLVAAGTVSVVAGIVIAI